MKYGRFEKIRPKYRNTIRKSSVLLCLILVLCMAIGGTLAFVIYKTGSVTNLFSPTEVACAVISDDDGNIFVKNTGDIPAYIRATYTVNWMDANGNVSGTKPTYTPTINSTDWSVGDDGFYYYKNKVDPEVFTNSFVKEFVSEQSGEYWLTVEVVAEAIQADGMGVTSAEDAWKAASGS